VRGFKLRGFGGGFLPPPLKLVALAEAPGDRGKGERALDGRVVVRRDAKDPA